VDGVSDESVQRQQQQQQQQAGSGPDHERWWRGPAAGGEAAAEEVAVPVEEERGDAEAGGAGELRVRPAELLPELRRRPRLLHPDEDGEAS
jgi:hypothetical protein